MAASPNIVRNIPTTVPGTIVFMLLYFVATLLYPGGSQTDPHSPGFSWRHNYWCNLLNAEALNGQPNTARPIAMTALVVLGLTLALFWFRFPRYMHLGNTGRLAMQITGILSMSFALLIGLRSELLVRNLRRSCFDTLLLGYPWHDLVINISGGCGLIALAGTFSGLYIYRWWWLLIWGFVNLSLIFTNTYIYNTKVFIDMLPVIQKISFLSFLGWICCIETLGLPRWSVRRRPGQRPAR